MGNIESRPKTVFLDVTGEALAIFYKKKDFLYLLAWVSCSRSHHCANTKSKTTDHDNPRVGGHEPVCKAALEHGSGREADDTNPQTSVHESIVQI